MRFEHPNLLWLLLVIPPALAVFFWWGERRRRNLLTQFVESRLLAALTAGISPARRAGQAMMPRMPTRGQGRGMGLL